MSLVPFEALACPLDGSPLFHHEKSWCCDSGHSFDIARQGYVHLLPVQKKKSLDPGDSKEMVAARQRFLNAGYYEPISDAVNRAAQSALAEGRHTAFLDAGCGEGYYARRLADSLPEGQSASLVGLDISKWAVLAAAKQDKRLSWVVGSNANLPVMPGAVDCVLCLFGFPVYEQFCRVLRTGGLILQVDAGPDHLRELREIIYPELKPDRLDRETVPEGFRLLGTDTVSFELALSRKDAITDLLAMTPHLYRASAEGRERAGKLNSLTVTVEVILKRLEKL